MSNPFIPICLSARSQIKNDREEIRMADIGSIPIKKKSSIFRKTVQKIPKAVFLK